MKKAIAYTADIILGRTGEVITRTYQKEMIKQHAKDSNIEIVAWYEDDQYCEDIITRLGVQKMLAYDKPYDVVLVERFWVFSRSMPMLNTLFAEINKRGLKIEAATTMWDCVSQQCRFKYKPENKNENFEIPVTVRHRMRPLKIMKPNKFHFLPLMKQA